MRSIRPESVRLARGMGRMGPLGPSGRVPIRPLRSRSSAWRGLAAPLDLFEELKALQLDADVVVHVGPEDAAKLGPDPRGRQQARGSLDGGALQGSEGAEGAGAELHRHSAPASARVTVERPVRR